MDNEETVPRVFENPPALPHRLAVEVIERSLRDPAAEDAAATVLVGCALNDSSDFIEFLCLQIGARALPGSQLLGLAGLCLGQAARRFGHLSDDAFDLAQSLAERAGADPSDLDSRALDGYDDVRCALGR